MKYTFPLDEEDIPQLVEDWATTGNRESLKTPSIKSKIGAILAKLFRRQSCSERS